MKKLKVKIIYSLISIIVFSCSGKDVETISIDNMEITNSSQKKNHTINHKDTIISFFFKDSFEVLTEIKYPNSKNFCATILILHGWNLPSNEWCEKTDFCKQALERGYALVIPDYKKSNYCLEVYPETIEKYKNFPTISWIIQSHIPYLHSELGLFDESDNNFITGISTGGRGATLLSYYLPNIFKGVASLSGDFDISQMQNEYLYYSFLGEYAKFKDRWEKECFAKDCLNFNTAIYIGHGEKDKVSPVEQSKMMYDSIKTNRPDLLIECNFPPEAKHDYIYWASETSNILDFFDKVILL